MYVRQRIISLHHKGVCAKQIQRTLLADGIKADGIKTYTRTVRDCINRHRESGSIVDKKRSGRPSKFLPHHLRFIDSLYEDDDELTAVDIQRILQETQNLSVSVSALKRIRKKLQWVQTGARYCQLMRVPNRQKRLDFCREALANNDTFDNVIFTDECSIQLDTHSRITFRKKGCPRKFKPRAKHPVKVHVWATISKRGPSQILIF